MGQYSVQIKTPMENGWVGLNPDASAEGSTPNCEVPDA